MRSGFHFFRFYGCGCSADFVFSDFSDADADEVRISQQNWVNAHNIRYMIPFSNPCCEAEYTANNINKDARKGTVNFPDLSCVHRTMTFFLSINYQKPNLLIHSLAEHKSASVYFRLVRF